MTPTLLTLAMTLAADPIGPPIDTSFLRQYAETRGFMLGRPAKPKITPDGKAVLFLRSGPTSPKQSLFEFDVATKQTKELLAPDSLLKGADENLSPEEKARRERQRVTAGGFADYHLDEEGKRVLVSLSGKLFVLDRGTGKTTELKTGPGPCIDPKWSPDGKMVSYVRGQDVYVYSFADGKESAVTTGGTPVVTHGLAEFVAQEEMHRHTGYWWSPDSKFIAYEVADHIGVEVWYPTDPTKPEGTPVPQYYPRPGKKNVAVKLGIVPVAGGKTVGVEWDRKKYEYLAAVRWDSLGPLTIQVQDRKQQSLLLLKVDPTSGRTSKLVEETDSSFLNLNPNVPAWLPDDKGFIWVGEPTANLSHPKDKGLSLQYRRPDGTQQYGAIFWKDGFRELLAVDPTTGRAVALMTRGTQLTEVIEDSRVPFVNDPNPTLSNLVRFNPAEEFRNVSWRRLLGGRITGNAYVLATSFSKDLMRCAMTATTLNHMPRTTIRGDDGDLPAVAELPSVAREPPFPVKVAVAKNGEFFRAVVRPRNFDPAKKYPVIVDVYGGPGHLHVIQAMKNWLVPQWLADQGFIVVAIDNRGTPGRGRDWERAIYQNFGTVPLEDQVNCLQELGRTNPELDLTRVGIVGWSFGGYMAANAVLRRPDVFHAAVAGAPVTDWEDYDTHYTERYLGLLPESRKAYDEASLIPLAKNLSRPLLLVHGTADDNVFYRHTLKLSDALFRAGKPFDVLPLPGITHMYTTDPQVTERLWERNVTFFRKHLGGPK